MKKHAIHAANLFLEFQRKATEESGRFVEGFAFVNELMPGDRFAWSRTAIEEATGEYETWGNIREMHQPNAVGVRVASEWRDGGYWIRAEIVDDKVWEKIEKGVYKGFSMAIKPLAVRGTSVSKCRIAEISVVDQPKDVDCPLSIARDAAAEEVEEIPSEYRGMFADAMKTREKSTLQYAAGDLLGSILWQIQNDVPAEEREAKAREALTEYMEYMVPLCCRAELGDPAPLAEFFAEPNALSERAAQIEDLTVRLQDAEKLRTDLEAQNAEVLTRVEKAEARVLELEALPEKRPPVKFTQAFERTFQEGLESRNADASKLESEYDELVRSAPAATSAEREARVTRIQQLKVELRALGIPK